MSAHLLKMLLELGAGWFVKLEANPEAGADVWHLSLGRSIDRGDEARAFVYVGKLDSVIQRAWAGGPPDRTEEI